MNNNDKYSLTDLYEKYHTDITFNEFYYNITKHCDIHKPFIKICRNEPFLCNSFINYLTGIPNLFQKLNLSNLIMSYALFIAEYGEYGESKQYLDNLQLASTLVILKFIINGIDFESYGSKLFYEQCTSIMKAGNIKLTEDIEIVLLIISLIVKPLCCCKRPFNLNCVSSDNFGLQSIRPDLIEKVIYETELNNYFFFLEIRSKLVNLKQRLGAKVRIDISDIDVYSGQLKNKILDCFQELKKSSPAYGKAEEKNALFVYNKQFVCSDWVPLLPEENMHYIKIYQPKTCFMCDQFDVIIKYEIENKNFIEYIDTAPVSNFACNKCKLVLFNHLNLKHLVNPMIQIKKSKLLNIPPNSKLLTKTKNTSYFNLRRQKPLLLISSNLFDTESLFANIPLDIIYAIIFSIYWLPINAVTDYDSVNTNTILYSKYRHLIKL